jgi:hypothetical protein
MIANGAIEIAIKEAQNFLTAYATQNEFFNFWDTS